MSGYEQMADEFCQCETSVEGKPIWNPECVTHRMMNKSATSVKRHELFTIGQTIAMIGKTLSDHPLFPDNVFPMTLQELLNYVTTELGQMNERGEP